MSRSEDFTGAELGGFLEAYVRYASTLTDAPEEYHIFCGLAALSAAARQVWVPYGTAKYPPGLWVVLVGGSGFYRKTTSMELARRILKHAWPKIAKPTIYEPSRVFHMLCDHDRMVVLDDFSWLLASPISERLTELGDRGSALSLLAGTSPLALSRCVTAAELAAGFLTRFCLVVPGEKRDWRGMPGERRGETERRLGGLLIDAMYLRGSASFELCQAGLREWVNNTIEWTNSMGGHPGHQAAAYAVASRLQLTLMKLAALIELSRAVGNGNAAARDQAPAKNNGRRRNGAAATAGWPVISPHSFEQARKLAGFVRASFGHILTHKLREGLELANELRLMAMVRNQPGITRRRLQQNSHLDAWSFGRTLVVLERNGRVRRHGNQYFAPGNGAPARSNGGVLAADSANTQVTEPATVSH